MLNTVSIVGSASRRAGGLFESVRRLHQELTAQNLRNAVSPPGACFQPTETGPQPVAEGIRVQVLTLQDEFTETDLGAWRPVPVRPFACSGPRVFAYSQDLMRQLLALQPDLVHVHGLWQFPSVAALVWHRKTHRPCLISPHGMLDRWALRNARWKKTLGWLAYERSHLKSAACIRALCPAEARAIRALGLTNPICIIPNGVDLPPSPPPTPDARTSGGHSQRHCFSSSVGLFEGALRGRKVLLYLGRIHPKKGLPQLLRAWAKVRASPEWLLVIAGWDQGGHEPLLKSLADDLEIPWNKPSSSPTLETSLLFIGPQFGLDKQQWLRRCDAFILPSFSEGLPMTILEAWSHARPVLMTPHCNLPEAFDAGAALRIGCEPDSIATGLRELVRLNDPARQRMGLSGLALVSSRFAWPRIAAELREVYHWITRAGPKPECVLRH